MSDDAAVEQRQAASGKRREHNKAGDNTMDGVILRDIGVNGELNREHIFIASFLNSDLVYDDDGGDVDGTVSGAIFSALLLYALTVVASIFAIKLTYRPTP